MKVSSKVLQVMCHTFIPSSSYEKYFTHSTAEFIYMR